jgi:copper chaperone CopZ
MSEINTNKTILTASEIVCDGCANSIKKALGQVEGISKVDVDVNTKIVTVEHTKTVKRETIVEALENAGYSVIS